MKRFLLPHAWWRLGATSDLTKAPLGIVVRRTISGYPEAASEWLRRIGSGERAAQVTLEEFVSQAARESPRAQEALFILFSDRAVQWARSKVPNIDDACDAVQSAFMIAFAALPGLDRAGAFGSWLRTIVENQAVNQVRRRLRIRETPLGPDEADRAAPSFESPPARAELSESMERLWRRIQRLPRKKRALAALMAAGLNYNEIAESLGISVGSVSSMIHRLRSEFREWADRDNDARASGRN